MKVLELTGEPIGTGGQEMFIINVLRHIDLTGMQIDWLTPYYCENEIYRHEIEDRGGEVACFNLPFSPEKSRNNIIKPLNRFLKKNHYDVIHIHSGSISILALCSLVAKWNGIKKIIVHSHSTGLSKSLRYRILKITLSPILKLCPTHFFACSKSAGEWKFPKSIVNSRLKIVENGIDLSLFSPNNTTRMEYRKKLQISDNTLLIGHVGRFSFTKNQEFLVEILSHLKQLGKDIKILFIGEGETFDWIKSLVSEKNMINDVIFTGSVTNVYDYMQAMDVFAFPSRWEGLGFVGIEAQAIGLPVVASDSIPVAMKLVDDVTFVSLTNTQKWMDCLNRKPLKTRPSNAEFIRQHGYDINDTVQMVRNIYIHK